MPRYLIFNATDGINATPDEYFSLRAAIVAKDELRASFKRLAERQGFYRTADGDQIDPTFVELVIYRSGEFYRNDATRWVLNDNYDSPAEQLGSLLAAERFKGAKLEYPGFIVLTQVEGLPAGYSVKATPWFDGAMDLEFQVFDPQGQGVASLTGYPFPSEEAGLFDHILAYKSALLEATPRLVKLARTIQAQRQSL